MTMNAAPDAYGVLTEPTTLTIRRVLPGPIGRVWNHLTRSDLRRRWLASGDMPNTPGATFALTWRNDELTDPPGTRPDGFGAEHSMESRITVYEPPHRLGFSWSGGGQVTITLQEQEGTVLLTLVHERIAERSARLMIGAGWHQHLDILVARVSGEEPRQPFWDGWQRLRQDYDRRLPA
ncbi:SRPBCC family protein [Alsobacter sp. R-9]